MVSAGEILIVAGFVFAAFAPSILYLVWLRNIERFSREPWGQVLKAFAWGAVGGVVLAVILSEALGARPDEVGASRGMLLYGAVVVAPVAEEFAKALGLRWVRDDHPELEDGLIFGAAAGLGFAATENLLYEFNAFITGGFGVFALTVVVRSVSSALLHASASAFVGLGMWRARLGHGGLGGVFAFYLLAVVLHGAFNYAASAELLVGFLFALGLALGVFGWLRKRIHRLDASAALEPTRPIGPL